MSGVGYSGTPLFRKLGYKPEFMVRLHNEPSNYIELLDEIPDGVRFKNEDRLTYDLIHFFTKDLDELEEYFPKFKSMISKDGMIWVSWPKKSSKVETTVDEPLVRAIGLAIGLVDVKICAVDEIWSGLKFMYRKKDR